MIIRILAWAALCLCTTSCHRTAATDGREQTAPTADTLIVRSNSPLAHKLKLDTVVCESFSPEFRTVGTVRAIAGRLASIAAPFDGRITHSAVQLGQQVMAGAVIFELGSPDFYEASKAYFQSVRSNETAQKNHARKTELLANGIASQRDAEEALTEAENTRREVEQAEANLRIFNADPANLQMGQSLQIGSPIAGEIVACDITVGQYVKSDAEPLATVADLRRVWITALVKEKYFGAIKKGDRAEVYTDAEPGSVIWGEIFHIGEILDEQTRSVQVLVECDNTQRKLKPGMFTSVHFLSQPREAVLLPATALFQSEQSSYVFIAADKEHFVRRDVTAETIKGGRVHILTGLTGGEQIVTEGGIYLTDAE